MFLFETEICIVDDDPLYGDILFKFLTNSKCKVRRFASGIDVLENLEKKPDIIFMDLHMDAINGLQASKILKKRWPQVNIILISSTENAEIILNENSGDYDWFEPKSGELSGMLLQIKNFQRRKMRRVIIAIALTMLVLGSLILLMVNALA